MLFRRIFEQCLEGLPESQRTEINWARIAKRLWDCAATGERNPAELKIAATDDSKIGGLDDARTSWSTTDTNKLKQLATSGASAAKASVVLTRSGTAVRSRQTRLVRRFAARPERLMRIANYQAVIADANLSTTALRS
jgi:hypothetical protein